ncbi:hypothetical protein D3C80_1227660 [compost metagenome]
MRVLVRQRAVQAPADRVAHLAVTRVMDVGVNSVEIDVLVIVVDVAKADRCSVAQRFIFAVVLVDEAGSGIVLVAEVVAYAELQVVAVGLEIHPGGVGVVAHVAMVDRRQVGPAHGVHHGQVGVGRLFHGVLVPQIALVLAVYGSREIPGTVGPAIHRDTDDLPIAAAIVLTVGHSTTELVTIDSRADVHQQAVFTPRRVEHHYVADQAVVVVVQRVGVAIGVGGRGIPAACAQRPPALGNDLEIGLALANIVIGMWVVLRLIDPVQRQVVGDRFLHMQL